jgi:nucleotide-binding universal stress UspA family protein
MTLSITRILVPVDFSGHAERAFEYAAMLGRQFDASLELVHVVDAYSSASWGSEVCNPNIQELMEDLIADAHDRLRHIRDLAATEGDRVELAVLTGPPAQAIVDRAEIGSCDLIVMGTHGRTGIAHALMGSVAERVVRSAGCPVITVRQTAVARTVGPDKRASQCAA